MIPRVSLGVLALAVSACAAGPVEEDASRCGANRWPGAGAPMSATGDSFAVGEPLPELQTFDQFGDPFCVSQLRGRAFVLAFTVSWGVPGGETLPAIDAALAGRDDAVSLTVLAQDEDGDPAAVDDAAIYAAGFEIVGPVGVDPEERYAAAYPDGIFPALYVVDEALRVRVKVATLSCDAAMTALGDVIGVTPVCASR